MTDVQIRRATVADAAGIAAVNTRSWREAYAGLVAADFLNARVVSPATWVERLTGPEPRSTTVVAVAEESTTAGAVVGFASVGSELSATDPDGPGQLYAIYLLADWWGEGIGHRLHTAAIRALVERGFAHAVLWVLDTNERAIAFYQREGWRLDGGAQVETEGSTPLDEVRMRRSLEPDPRRRHDRGSSQ